MYYSYRFCTVTIIFYPIVFCDHTPTKSELFYYAILNETMYGFCKVSENFFTATMGMILKHSIGVLFQKLSHELSFSIYVSVFI
jgi:hypothetical protein